MPNPYDIQQERMKEVLQTAPPEMIDNIREMSKNQMLAHTQLFGAPEDHLHDLDFGLPIATATCSDAFYHESVVMTGGGICSPHASTCLDDPDNAFIMPAENVFSISNRCRDLGVHVGVAAHHRAEAARPSIGLLREKVEDFQPELKWEYKDMDNEVKKEPLTMEVGKRYLIETKKGQVKKYLSFIDERTDTYYFVEKRKKINSEKLGWMFAGRGTAHAIQNVASEVE